jgi:hypothetical protein
MVCRVPRSSDDVDDSGSSEDLAEARFPHARTQRCVFVGCCEARRISVEVVH